MWWHTSLKAKPQKETNNLVAAEGVLYYYTGNKELFLQTEEI